MRFSTLFGLQILHGPQINRQNRFANFFRFAKIIDQKLRVRVLVVNNYFDTDTDNGVFQFLN